jgi:hypothetical protein
MISDSRQAGKSSNLTPFDSNWTVERVVTHLFGSFGFVRFPSPAPTN